MAALEIKVNGLVFTVAGIVNNLEDMMKLSSAANNLEDMMKLSSSADLVTRIKQSLASGYDTLKDTIHYSLLGQTSSLQLPTDQLGLVQNKVREVSTGIFHT